ncbi:MAG: carbohydrate ABC transporter substrate-binding protein [Clostridia bacterium]|nr:carbohydrate ABC transporter substrate-binding protein [Clostridia bacterium]
MRKYSVKKIASAALAVVMAASSLTALSSCGKKEPVKEKRTNVYSGIEITLPEGVDYVQNLFHAGENICMMYNKVFTITYNESGEEVGRVPGYQWDSEGLQDGWWQDYQTSNYVATLDSASGEISEVKIDVIQNDTGNSYMHSMRGGADGTAWALINTWEYADDYSWSRNTYTLRAVDPVSGEMSEGVLLNDALLNAGIDEANMYINNFVVTEAGKIYLSTDTCIVGVDRNGTFKEKIQLDEDGWMNGMFAHGEKLYTLFYPNSGSQKLKVIEDGKITDISTETLKDIMQAAYSFYGFSDTKMYYSTNSGIHVYDFTTDTTAELMNYINSDVDSGSTGSAVVLPDERIAIVQTDWSSDVSTNTVALLSRVPDEQLQEEIILDLGCLYSDYYLTKAIIKFNKQNTGVRISVRDYSQYNNEDNEWKGASIQFNNDIVTGNVPDIVLLSSELPAESYFQKGLFADLYSFMDDPEIGVSRADYLENVLKACEVDGKLYSMILSFTLSTLAAKSEFVGTESGWTLAEMMEVIRNMPEGMSAFLEYSRQNVLENFFSYSMDTFVNWETGETYFEDEGFVEFMKFLETCPEKGFWEAMYPDDGTEYVYDEELEKEYYQKYDLRFYKDYSLFSMANISNFTRIMNDRGMFATKDITYIGFPTNDESSNGATILPQAELAVSAQSLAQREAWSFIKFVLNDETYNANTWAFSTNLRRLEEKKAKAADDYYYYEQTEDDLAWYKEYYSEEYFQYMLTRNQPLDESTIDQTMDIIRGASKVQRSDSALLDIINEELSVFFSGTRSAEETAKIINSRARIYVSENS